MYFNNDLLSWVICVGFWPFSSGEFSCTNIVIYRIWRHAYYLSLWLVLYCERDYFVSSSSPPQLSSIFSLLFFPSNSWWTIWPILPVQQLELRTHWKSGEQDVSSNLSWSGSRVILSTRAIRLWIISLARCSCLISWKAVFPQGSLRSCFSGQRNLLVLKQ